MNRFSVDTQSLLDRFIKYVQIDSETGKEGAFATFLKEELKELGFIVTTDEAYRTLSTDGFNIYATLEGDDSLEPLLFCAHMDTVSPAKGIHPQVDEDGYVRSDGTTILGGDDKAGLCAMIEAMVEGKKLPHRPKVELVLTVEEEGGLFGAKALDFDRITAKKGIVLDSCGGPNQITVEAPSQRKIEATIYGKTAHAGIAPEDGVSAIQVAAVAVSNMQLLRVNEYTTCNIGTFHSVGPTNIVSPQAELTIEIRSRKKEMLENHTQHILSCLSQACNQYGGRLEYQLHTNYEAFSFPADHPWVEEVKTAITAIGLSPVLLGSGGGSDANVLNLHGIDTLNLGIGMEQVHTCEEQQNILQMYQGSEVCYQLIRLAGESKGNL